LLPEVFDVVVTLPVHDDCTVNFENRSYGVPFRLCGLSVEFADVRKSCGWFTRATWRLNILAAAGDDY
jgi:hypothetical protein